MFTINARVRQTHGKGASRRLRHQNRFPAIVYGGDSEAVAIELEQDKMMNMQSKTDFYHSELTLVIDGVNSKVKVQAIQRHPFKPKILHMDFIRI